MAGASTGIPGIDAPYFNMTDQDGLQKEATAAMKLGFHGKCAIHPSHIAAINSTFTPSAEEIARARRVLAASQQGVVPGGWPHGGRRVSAQCTGDSGASRNCFIRARAVRARRARCNRRLRVATKRITLQRFGVKRQDLRMP